MEEKLTRLFIAAKEFTEKSKKFYAEIEYNGAINKIEVNIRVKIEHGYVETREIYFENANINKVDELIEFIKYYEEAKK